MLIAVLIVLTGASIVPELLSLPDFDTNIASAKFPSIPSQLLSINRSSGKSSTMPGLIEASASSQSP